MRKPLVFLHPLLQIWERETETGHASQGSRRPTNKLQRRQTRREGGGLMVRGREGHKHAHSVRHGRNIPDTFSLAIVEFYPKRLNLGKPRRPRMKIRNCNYSLRASFRAKMFGILQRARVGLGSFSRKVDGLLRISQRACKNPGWRSGVHTDRGNKVLLVQTPRVKVTGSSARRVVRQLQVGNIEENLRSGRLHATGGTLFAPGAAGAVGGASLSLFWV